MHVPAPALPIDADFELSAGRLCLDLPNTLNRRPTAEPRELLTSYGHLVAWARLAGLVDDGQAAALLGEAANRPTEATRVLRRAVALREAIYAAMHAVVEDEPVPDAALATINAEAARASARARIVATDGGFAWGWDGAGPALDRPLWPVARSAAELLTSSELPQVRECAADNCAWLFIDTSKNRSRRWCDMAVCGNRAKARRHYARAKRSVVRAEEREARGAGRRP